MLLVKSAFNLHCGVRNGNLHAKILIAIMFNSYATFKAYNYDLRWPQMLVRTAN